MLNPPPVSSSRAATQVWSLLLLSSAAYFFSVNQADNDLWGHLFAGREILARGGIPRVDTYAYTVTGQPWLNHEWLTHVVFFTLYRWGGAPALLLWKFGAGCFAFGLVLRGSRRVTTVASVWGAVGLLTVAAMARGAAIRPQLFT